MLLAAGCLPQATIPAETTALGQSPDPLELSYKTVPEGSVSQEEIDEPETSQGLSEVVSSEKPLPQNIHPGEALGSLLKLFQAGVEENVLLSFVANTTSAFSLGADEIVYLSDIGVPGPVVSAMLQHDHMLVDNAEAAAASPVGPVMEPILPGPPPVVESDSVPPEHVENQMPLPETGDSDAGFYEPLAPYGTWVDIEGSGRCWQPSVAAVNRDWRPYCDRGHWVYTDCGWYWASDYSWGWAPFHYGRWFQHAHLGWCWAPDKVWSPSWVCWRSSKDYCGWAPLPPSAHFRPGLGFVYRGHSVGFNFNFGVSERCYTFVPLKNFADLRLSQHLLKRDQVSRIFQNTVAINRIVGDKNKIANYGIQAERITAVTHTRIHQVAVRTLLRNEPDEIVSGSTEHQLGGAGRAHEGINGEPRFPAGTIRERTVNRQITVRPSSFGAPPQAASFNSQSASGTFDRRSPEAWRREALASKRPEQFIDSISGRNPRELSRNADRAERDPQRRIDPQERIYIGRPQRNFSPLAARSADFSSRNEARASSFGSPRRSVMSGFQANVEGHPRYERTESTPDSQNASASAHDSMPMPTHNGFGNWPVSQFAPAHGSPSMYGAAPNRGSVSEVPRHDFYANRNAQSLPSLESAGASHHQNQPTPPASPAVSVHTPSPPASSSAASSSSSDRHGR